MPNVAADATSRAKRPHVHTPKLKHVAKADVSRCALPSRAAGVNWLAARLTGSDVHTARILERMCAPTTYAPSRLYCGSPPRRGGESVPPQERWRADAEVANKYLDMLGYPRRSWFIYADM